MPTDLARRQQTHFVLWRPAHTQPPPRLVIGQLQPGNPPAFVNAQQFDLAPVAGLPDLWAVAAAGCNLADAEVYHYWFEVGDSDPDRTAGQRILITDPTARAVDWRLRAPRLPAPYGDDDRDPAGVIKWHGGALVACDPGGDTPDYSGDAPLAGLPPNNRLVIYELPTAWATRTDLGGVEIGVGTFRDTLALVEPGAEAANFSGVEVFEAGAAHLLELGANALELVPPADSWVFREWGYATSNYFAADFDLGFPNYHASPTATTDLVRLITACHRHGVRFFLDVVMAFATRYALQNLNYHDFHVRRGTGDPEEYDHEGRPRQDFGGKLFKYAYFPSGYDPVDGATRALSPARQLLKAHLLHWLDAYRVDGLRVDSTKNIVNWDFLQEFREAARAFWRQRWAAQGNPPAGADERFLVVGEELPPRLGLVTTGRLDGLWNEPFLERARGAVLGETHLDGSFEEMVRNLVDCTRPQVGYPDGAAAVNYLTSHDVEGYRKERLRLFLANNGVASDEEASRRIKLAFACLLTAVGVPMILAGEEFADEHDRATTHPAKQSDPVNFSRIGDGWRKDLFRYVARLVRLRTTSDALAVNDTAFIHTDFTPGRRVMAWRRGRPDVDDPVVVVANFSDFRSDRLGGPPFEYRVPNWPATPAGRRWREVSQDRDVPDEWVGREPLFPWEAKVYTLA